MNPIIGMLSAIAWGLLITTLGLLIIGILRLFRNGKTDMKPGVEEVEGGD